MSHDVQLTVEDRIAIEDLLTRICEAVDDGDATALGACLTSDVSFDVGFGAILGRDAVTRLFGERLAHQDHIARHLWSNLSIGARDGDRVSIRSAFATFAVLNPGSDEAKRTWRCGDHHDVVQKGHDGRWLMAERKVGKLIPD